MSTDDVIDDLLGNSPKVGEPSEGNSNSGARSRADDIVDAVKKAEVSERNDSCWYCKSKSIRKVKPLGGGTYFIKCQSCKREVPIGGIPSKAIALPKQLPHGSYYSSSVKPVNTDKHAPNYRLKSKSKGIK